SALQVRGERKSVLALSDRASAQALRLCSLGERQAGRRRASACKIRALAPARLEHAHLSRGDAICGRATSSLRPNCLRSGATSGSTGGAHRDFWNGPSHCERQVLYDFTGRVRVEILEPLRVEGDPKAVASRVRALIQNAIDGSVSDS